MTINKKLLLIFGIILAGIAIAIVAVIFLYYSSINSAIGADETKKIVEIEEGSSVTQIAEELESLGYIKSTWAFLLYVRLNDKILLAGPHLISENMSVVEIIDTISVEETIIKKITIPEGWRIEQIAAYLDDEGYVDYQKFVELGEPYRGKLFPDTFYITTENTEGELLQMMLDDYKTRVKNLNVSKDDLMLASIIEREALTDEERAKIAGVFTNRLAINMLLETDPTILYANDTKELLSLSTVEALDYKYWQPVVFSKYKQLDSPYNTYLKAGLPPTPICNPGIKSIEAAVKPESHNYFYFFHSKSQEIYFSKTLEEHNQNKAMYLGS